jgi:nitrile hydratase accessory protein
LSGPDVSASGVLGPLAELPRLPRDAGGPVFAEPWQAQAFALAVTLSERGHFTWKEWASALAGELEAAGSRGQPDDGSRYYEHWLAALERIVTEKGLADSTALRTRTAAWVAAYENTPHGRPVELPPSPVAARRWLAVGLTGAVAGLWAIQTMGVEALPPVSGWTAGNPSLAKASSEAVPALGLAASAGFGALLGMRHAVEPDHLAAITTLMTGARSSTKAAMLGACWGLGHTLTLLTTGALLVLLQAEMPALAARVFEGGVVLLLVGFGIRAIRLSAGRGILGPTHSHGALAQAPASPDRWTLARPLVVGAVHGLAGTGALMALVVTTLPSAAAQLGYLLLFGVGSTVGMAALSGLLGWPIARLGAHHVVARAFSLAAGSASVALGLSLGLSVLREGFG